jgi:hypothetical protein
MSPASVGIDDPQSTRLVRVGTESAGPEAAAEVAEGDHAGGPDESGRERPSAKLGRDGLWRLMLADGGGSDGEPK